MDSFIDRIRFPLMTRYDFSNIVFPTGILTEDEYTSILRYISRGVKDGLKLDYNPRKKPVEPVVADIIGLKCVSIDRPGTEIKASFNCKECQTTVCLVYALNCHETHGVMWTTRLVHVNAKTSSSSAPSTTATTTTTTTTL